MQKIGQLFLLRTNINSVGSVLDSPVRKCSLGTCGTLLTYSLGSVLGSRGLLWGPFVKLIYPSQQSYPDLQPLYDAARSYLEIPQRINLLNTRVEVRISHSISSRKSKQNIDRTAGASRHAAITQGIRVEQTRRTAGTNRYLPHRNRNWCVNIGHSPCPPSLYNPHHASI